MHSAAKISMRVLLGAALTACAVGALREEAAAWYAREGSVEGLRKAESWDPADPAYPAAMARLEAAHLETADARAVASEIEMAIQKGPRRAIYWANLGEAYEIDGRERDARGAYERALEIFPKSPEINWQYANFLVRSGDVEQALRPLREVIVGDESLRPGAFDLAWRAGATSEKVLTMIPARQDVLSAYLDYLVQTERLDAAKPVWQRLMASPDAFDTDAGFRYFDALLGVHRVDAMVEVWNDLERHDPAKFRAEAGSTNLIVDGSFEQPIPNGGFGWRAVPIEGAKIFVDATAAQDGTRAVEIEFSGADNLKFGNVMQYVAVTPNTAYKFRAFARREGITTDSGPRIAVYDAYDHEALWMETPNLLGTADWEEQSLDFRTGPRTRLLAVQIVRPPSRKLDNRIAGRVWMGRFSLIAER
jgi:hypothetical protein